MKFLNATNIFKLKKLSGDRLYLNQEGLDFRLSSTGSKITILTGGLFSIYVQTQWELQKEKSFDEHFENQSNKSIYKKNKCCKVLLALHVLCIKKRFMAG